MKKKEEVAELVEITEREFLLRINQSLEYLDNCIGENVALKKEFVKLYHNYLVNKSVGANIKYYSQGGVLSYKATEKNKIGFRHG